MRWWWRRGREAVERPLEGTVTSHAQLELRLRTRLVLHWADIAIDQERLARDGRADLERGREVGECRPKAEFHPALIAVAACAHSLDALYGEFAQLVGPVEASKRWAQVAGILELAVERDVEPWRPRLQTLFTDLRNPAVHPKAEGKEALPHPVFEANAPAEYAICTVEAVRESVDLLFEILSACVEAPKAPVVAWANDTRALVEGLQRRRRAC
jgi:hypothetical protein